MEKVQSINSKTVSWFDLGNGITDDMTFETELYAFPQKTQDFL